MRAVILCLAFLLVSLAAQADDLPNSSITNGCSLQGTGGGHLKCITGGAYTLSIKSANLGATGDAGSFVLPTNVTKYTVTSLNVANCSVIPVLAQAALWTGAAGTGTSLVAAATITGATSATVLLSQTVLSLTATAGTLFLNVPVANATALTCDVYLTIKDLS